MTYEQNIKKFLEKVLQIFNSNPKRREPGDGSNGYCDCIGLIIGAIRRMGLKWTGIHGSNWAARKEIVNLQPIESISQLKPGDIVLKGKPQGEKGWDLPSRYRSGGRYYNGDLTDYYHAGVVYSIEPFQIRHMASVMTIDTKLNRNTKSPWNYFGRSRQIIDASSGYMPEPEPVVGQQAYVLASSGKTVNLRSKPSTISSIIARVPLNTIVTIEEPGEEWCVITYKNKKGYMMAKFLDIIGDGKGKY